MWKSDYLVILFDAPDYTILKSNSGSASARSLKRHNIPTMKCSLLLVMCLLTFHPSLFSQKQHLIDSLLIDLQRLNDYRKATGTVDTTLRDTSIINNLVNLAMLHRSNPDSGQYYASLVVDWAKKIDYKKALGIGYNVLGTASKMQGNYPAAIDYFQKSIDYQSPILLLLYSLNWLSDIQFLMCRYADHMVYVR